MPHEVVRAKHFTSTLKAEADEGVTVDRGGQELTVVTALQVSKCQCTRSYLPPVP